MKNSIRHIINQPILFKQWSNTSYAIFGSIGRVVQIGFLSNIIHGLETVKALISHGFLMLFEVSEGNEFDEDVLLQHDPLDLLNVNESIAYDNCILSIRLPNTVFQGINYINNKILEGPFLGLFSFVGIAHFMRIPTFFVIKNQLIKQLV